MFIDYNNCIQLQGGILMTYQITETRKLLREMLARKICKKSRKKALRKPLWKALPMLVDLKDIDIVPAVEQPGLPGEFYITPDDKVDFISDACKKRLRHLTKYNDSPWCDEWSLREEIICWMYIS